MTATWIPTEGARDACRTGGVRWDKALRMAAHLVSLTVRPGEQAVDATAGNGRDTLLLARLVGPHGKVYAFDIQQEALERTAAALEAEGMRERVILIPAGHQTLARHVRDEVAAVMFNLGYLPGGNHRIVTRGETTVEGLRAALSLLRPGGLVSVVVYPGHRGGIAEKRALKGFSRGLDQKRFACAWTVLANQAHHPPELVTVQRL